MMNENFFQTVDLLQQVLQHEDTAFHVALMKVHNSLTKEEVAVACQELHLTLEPLLCGPSIPSSPTSIGMWFAALGEACRVLMTSDTNFDEEQFRELNQVHMELQRLIHLDTWSFEWIPKMWNGEWMPHMEYSTHNGHVKSVWDCPTGGLQSMHIIHILGMCLYRYGRMNSEDFIEKVLCQVINRFSILKQSIVFVKALALMTFGVAQHFGPNYEIYSGYGAWCKSLRYRWSNPGFAFYPLLASLPIFVTTFKEDGRSSRPPAYDDIPGHFSSYVSERTDFIKQTKEAKRVDQAKRELGLSLPSNDHGSKTPVRR